VVEAGVGVFAVLGDEGVEGVFVKKKKWLASRVSSPIERSLESHAVVILSFPLSPPLPLLLFRLGRSLKNSSIVPKFDEDKTLVELYFVARYPADKR
jgi:hypothetical protein